MILKLPKKRCSKNHQNQLLNKWAVSLDCQLRALRAQKRRRVSKSKLQSLISLPQLWIKSKIKPKSSLKCRMHKTKFKSWKRRNSATLRSQKTKENTRCESLQLAYSLFKHRTKQETIKAIVRFKSQKLRQFSPQLLIWTRNEPKLARTTMKVLVLM